MTGDRRAESRERGADLRTAIERRVRSAWREGPGPVLRGAGALFGLAVDLRNFAYDTGLLAARRAPLPTVSVGGLTVGGSGKTPIASAMAGWAARAGLRPAILSRGFADELEVHAHLRPDAVVLGHPERFRAALRARSAGAEIVYLDDGFQHRRLERDVDVVLVDADLLRGAPRRRLPAGPYRERWSALGRADAVVFVCRRGRAAAGGLLEWARRRWPRHTLAACHLRPGRVEPWSPGARRVLEAGGEPAPDAAVASVMKPELFLEQLATLGLRPSAAYLLPDHGRLPNRILEALDRGAGSGGVIGTLKDVVKLREPLAPETPLWCLTDELDWKGGRDALRGLVTDEALRRARRRGEGRPEPEGRSGDARRGPSPATWDA